VVGVGKFLLRSSQHLQVGLAPKQKPPVVQPGVFVIRQKESGEGPTSHVRILLR
jgi:hypothetical protein